MPQSDFKEETIDGVVYKVGMLPPRKALAILVEMTKVAGPALAAMANKDPDAEVDFGLIVSIMAGKLDQKMIDDHQAMFASVTEADGVPLKGIFDKHFHGRVMLMLQWHAFAVKANFSDFSEALGTVFARVSPPKAKTPASGSAPG